MVPFALERDHMLFVAVKEVPWLCPPLLEVLKASQEAFFSLIPKWFRHGNDLVQHQTDHLINGISNFVDELANGFADATQMQQAREEAENQGNSLGERVFDLLGCRADDAVNN